MKIENNKKIMTYLRFAWFLFFRLSFASPASLRILHRERVGRHRNDPLRRVRLLELCDPPL